MSETPTFTKKQLNAWRKQEALRRSVLRAHLDARENVLVAEGQGAGISSHPNQIGDPREAFVRNFLQDHLASTLEIGKGEVITAETQVGHKKRKPHDVVIFNRSFPKIDLKAGVAAFLAESVLATIEVKSRLKKDELKDAIKAIVKLKKNPVASSKGMYSGWVTPKPLAYVVSYDGPDLIKIKSWLDEIHAELSIALPDLPDDRGKRIGIASPTVDGIFVLGKGYLLYDNIPFHFLMPNFHEFYSNVSWIASKMDRGTLFMLFMLLTMSAAGRSVPAFDPFAYMKGWSPGHTWNFPPVGLNAIPTAKFAAQIAAIEAREKQEREQEKQKAAEKKPVEKTAKEKLVTKPATKPDGKG